MYCYASFGREAAIYRFCGNDPVVEYDINGLLTVADCDLQYAEATNAATIEGSKCLHSLVTWGLWGELGFGGGGILIGAPGGIIGSGIGLAIGTIVNGAVDVCHYLHCKHKVDKMELDALTAYTDCLNHVTSVQ